MLIKVPYLYLGTALATEKPILICIPKRAPSELFWSLISSILMTKALEMFSLSCCDHPPNKAGPSALLEQKRPNMPKKRPPPERNTKRLREAEVALGEGRTGVQVCMEIGRPVLAVPLFHPPPPT